MVELSVVVPAYDARAHLATTLASLRRNAHCDVELLVVDDACTDGTAEVPPGLRVRLRRRLRQAVRRKLPESARRIVRRARPSS